MTKAFLENRPFEDEAISFVAPREPFGGRAGAQQCWDEAACRA
jgi:hypothetical protein